MPTEILQPFSLTPSGGVATTSDPNQMAEQHINMILVTNPGERVMLGNYGVGAAQLVFRPDNGLLAKAVQTDVESQIKLWEPSISLNSVGLVDDDVQEGIVFVSVDWQLTHAATLSNTNTAVIQVGGTVLESQT